ncbi:MAG: hypothetical protein RQ745_03640 [Longimicrobiales bacterium]|nr:hypothetical protein [Longimicrobiales bacterium]
MPAPRRSRGNVPPRHPLHPAFDPEGRWLGTVEFPEDVRLHQAGPDWVLGVRTDDLGIAWIERYRILKPS